MKTLNLHVDYIKWEVLKKALKSIEELAPDQDVGKKEVGEALVVLTAIEKGDDSEVLKNYLKSIKEILKQVGTKKVVLYPYAHLSNNLGSPKNAIEILKNAYKKLSEEGYKVYLVPFGYYKSFELKVKGHPLSELSREIFSENETVDEIKDLSKEELKKLIYEISKSKLDTSKLAENDHRIIGKKMNLWSFSPAAPGMVFWHDKGLFIKNKLIEYWRALHRREGYEEISTPQIMDKKLWEVSGHWSKYHENNFRTKYEGRDFLTKPMNCPGGMLVYKEDPKSYKNFPLKVSELGVVHRVELSGVLSGLFRVIQFTQDDAHIFCTQDQAEEEVSKIMDLTEEILNTFNLKIHHIELSTRPKKRIGTKEEWDFAEKTLENVLKKKNIKYKINKGDGAFYGAKIDYHLEDSLGRTWQVSTIQFDMSLPRRFDLTYVDEKGKEKKPVMIHRAIYGSLERFIGIISESYNGKFPLWMSPNQVKILTMGESVEDYAKKIYENLFDAGFRVEIDNRNESIRKKVRDASIERFNYLVTIGEDEKKNKNIAVKVRDGKNIRNYSVKEFIDKLKKEIKGKNG